jgi:hypothetical protein
MNAPAKRFSLQRLLTTPPPPAPAPAPVIEPVAHAPEVELVPIVEELPVVEPPPARVVAPRAPRTAPEEPSHPKKKRSYSVDMKLCEDLEILAWYMSRSSSSVVEELIRKHLQHNKSVLLKAREVRNAR